MKLVAVVLVSVFVLGIVGAGALADSPSEVATDQLAQAVLSSPNIQLRPLARKDVKRRIVDPRVLQILLIAAQTHRLGVGPLISGHSYYIAGTSRPSNHVFGRAADITAVNGVAVSPMNIWARDVVEIFGSLPSNLRPDELGSPWEMSFPGVNTFVRDHLDHIHGGFSD